MSSLALFSNVFLLHRGTVAVDAPLLAFTSALREVDRCTFVAAQWSSLLPQFLGECTQHHLFFFICKTARPPRLHRFKSSIFFLFLDFLHAASYA